MWSIGVIMTPEMRAAIVYSVPPLNSRVSANVEDDVIDIHCHILPGVDDGAESWEIAEQMCSMAAADGITDIVATPHANDVYAFEREPHQAKLARLQEQVGNTVTLTLGCDFHLSYDNIQDALLHPQRYTIGESRYLLVELSDFAIPPQLPGWFQKLIEMGLTPIITHPERNPILQRNPQSVLDWVKLGCAVQVTASALTGFWGKTAKKSAEWLLDRRAVHFLASDAHDVQHRVPVLAEGREFLTKHCGVTVARALVEDNPGAVVADEELPYRPALKSA
jgi:protein-tyrosine phosphatase